MQVANNTLPYVPSPSCFVTEYLFMILSIFHFFPYTCLFFFNIFSWFLLFSLHNHIHVVKCNLKRIMLLQHSGQLSVSFTWSVIRKRHAYTMAIHEVVKECSILLEKNVNANVTCYLIQEICCLIRTNIFTISFPMLYSVTATDSRCTQELRTAFIAKGFPFRTNLCILTKKIDPLSPQRII